MVARSHTVTPTTNRTKSASSLSVNLLSFAEAIKNTGNMSDVRELQIGATFYSAFCKPSLMKFYSGFDSLCAKFFISHFQTFL